MCLDPRPDRTPRFSRATRRLNAPRRPAPLPTSRLAHATLPPPTVTPVVRAPALWALDTLAGADDLVARGWVVISKAR